MRALLLILTLILSFNSMARERVSARCENNATQVSEMDLMFFNTTKVIKLGECVGIELVKHSNMRELPQACSEVVEHNNNVFGSLSLSKKEALQIGLCLGVINYVYDRYHDETYRAERYNSYSSKRYNHIYQCEKGITAVSRLITTGSSLTSRNNIRDVLCIKTRY
ncbi:hypothetical protein [Moritella yayanosii]|uniref:Uncharacterized protein n=1 Tax=Moritella yayanosii TaxID=69539 RepID=A0A330LID1_9GAMM|nr:hypothetical protein [Moritella yayanosii]SQD76694.1 conserved exported protein of unknown function [Moritella yayanosii]